MIEQTLSEAGAAMRQLVTAFGSDLMALRSGRASASALARLEIVHDGVGAPLAQVASVGVPDARVALVTPYDTSLIGSIEQAIRDSDLGLDEPTNDGTTVRIGFPRLTAQRHQELTKVGKARGENTKRLIRVAGEHASSAIVQLLAQGKVADADADRIEGELQTLIRSNIDSIDEMLRST